MNARLFAALPFAIALGVFASASALAQDATPASSGSAMAQDGMQHKDAMKDSMPKRGTMMKDAMHGDTMKHATMHHDTMMKKNDSMKMKQAGSEPMGSGG
ncbi:MAG: pentapeptide MXKDX repeat protein [Pseudomonadota bacterium]